MTRPERSREADDVVFDTAGLSRAQRAGRACVVCGKRWPAPRLRVGRTADGAALFSCSDDAPLIARRPPARSAAT
ncbi:hypothetical protein [Actinomadura parmotrematis]|uniref:DNA primase n=1 Tax=Actinomadura parmotrematis TaxID=2864039 RepID=A0ABS7FL65_9ACTN|nr:hypothetical protein [Actinomadura parmotrematis]MBW8481113.1 hypothetical protein [Actinomadura parmotrematis]